jgi:hypothetical protein
MQNIMPTRKRAIKIKMLTQMNEDVKNNKLTQLHDYYDTLQGTDETPIGAGKPRSKLAMKNKAKI